MNKITLQFLASPSEARDFITDLGNCVTSQTEIIHSDRLAKYTVYLIGDDNTLDNIAVFDFGLEALRYSIEEDTQKSTLPLPKRYYNLERPAFVDLTVKGQNSKNHPEVEQRSTLLIAEREFSPTLECWILASQDDNLSALIKSLELDKYDKQAILEFCQLKAQKADAVISDTLTGAPKWTIRRNARNVQRRLLRALLYKHANVSLQASQGAKYRMLLNLAKSKNLI